MAASPGGSPGGRGYFVSPSRPGWSGGGAGVGHLRSPLSASVGSASRARPEPHSAKKRRLHQDVSARTGSGIVYGGFLTSVRADLGQDLVPPRPEAAHIIPVLGKDLNLGLLGRSVGDQLRVWCATSTPMLQGERARAHATANVRASFKERAAHGKDGAIKTENIDRALNQCGCYNVMAGGAENPHFTQRCGRGCRTTPAVPR